MPRRHAAIEQHLLNHGRPAFHLGVIRHREGPDLSRAVATDAVLLQHRRNDLAVGHRRGGGLHFKPDRASVGFGLGDRHGPAAEEFGEGGDQVRMGRLGLARLVGRHVVDGTPIEDLQFLRVDDHHFARGGDSQTSRHELLFIAQHWDRSNRGAQHLHAQGFGIDLSGVGDRTVLPSTGHHHQECITRILLGGGVHQPDVHSLFRRLALGRTNFPEGGAEPVAIEAGEVEHHRLGLGPAQFVVFAPVIQEAEIDDGIGRGRSCGGDARGAFGRGRRLCGKGGKTQGQGGGCKQVEPRRSDREGRWVHFGGQLHLRSAAGWPAESVGRTTPDQSRPVPGVPRCLSRSSSTAPRITAPNTTFCV